MAAASRPNSETDELTAMSEPLVIIGNGMAAARLCEELSQRAVARAAGVTLPVVRGAEEGRSQQMTLALVTRLAAALGCSVEEILEPSSVAPTVEGEASTSPGVDRKKKDAKRLEAVLFTAGKLVHYRALAEVPGAVTVEGAGRHVSGLVRRQPTLEDAFVKLVGRSMTEEEA